jgi:DUF4097 and DUF4098 domain-containing protein YvlB
MRTTFLSMLAACLVAGVVAPADAQARRTEPAAFEWRGELAAGQRLYLYTTNGPVRVEAASGRNLEITAAKSWRRGNPADVRIEAARVGDGVAVCAIWNDPEARCTEEGVQRARRIQVRGINNDTDVSFTVRLPAGAHITARTTNGTLVITGATGEVNARTTNGEVTAESSGGPVMASTTNGDVRIRVSRLPDQGASYRTTNGTITIELPDGINTNIEARTTNGGISSDFEVMVTGSISPRSLRGRIGSGGPTLSLSTTNGSIRIRKQ